MIILTANASKSYVQKKIMLSKMLTVVHRAGRGKWRSREVFLTMCH